MKRIALLIYTAVSMFLAGPLVVHAGNDHDMSTTGSPEFERMKKLAGVWEGTLSTGKEGDKVRVEYRLTSSDSALIETLTPGNEGEMVSVYHDEKGKLAMTHYCMLRNQPHMKLTQADARSIKLVFDRKGNVINPAKEKHMHAVSFAFTDNDHLVQKWTMFDRGKNAGEVEFTLTRVH